MSPKTTTNTSIGSIKTLRDSFYMLTDAEQAGITQNFTAQTASILTTGTQKIMLAMNG
jgi:hypothetical protein